MKLKNILVAAALTLTIPGQARAAEMTTDSADFSARVAPYMVRIGTSLIANATLTEVLKSSIHELRPDRSDNDSWPSRHSSWVTTIGSIVAHELYCKSPWWVLGAHAVTDAVMMQRVWSSNHYAKDVIGGMAVGLISAEIGYFLGNVIYPSHRKTVPAATSDFLPTIDVMTTSMFPLCGGAPGMSAHTAVNTAVRGTLPLSEHWGVSVATNFRSAPLYKDKVFMNNVDGIGAAMGCAGYWELPGKRWNAEAHAMAGFMHNFHGREVPHPSVSFTLDITAGAACAITPRLSAGAEAGYSYWALRRGVSALTIGIFTRASF